MMRKYGIVLWIVCCVIPTVVFAQSSENYSVIEANVSVGGVTTMTSQNYTASITLGQSIPLGVSTSESYQVLWGVGDRLVVVVRKSGTGDGTIIVGNQECGPACTGMIIPYIKHSTAMFQVVPEPDSYFVRWEKADGVPIAGTHYAQPDDVMIAIFEKK